MAKYCPECGKKLPDDAAFCDSCGTDVRTSETAKPASSTPAEEIKERIRKRTESAPAAENRAAKPVMKGSTGKLVIGAVVIVLLLFIVMNMRNKSDTKDNESTLYVPEMTAGTESSSSQTADSAPVKTSESITGQSAENAQDNTGTSSPLAGDHPLNAENIQENTQDTSQGDVSQGLASPSGDPTFEEFGYDELFYKTGLPMDRIDLPPGMADGEWKYLVVFNSNIPEQRIDEIGLAEIGIGDGTCTMVWHPQHMKYPDGTVIEESDETVGYTIFTGRWDDDGMVLQGNNLTVTTSAIYTYEGKDYLLAAVLSEAGMICDLMMVRP